MNGVITSKVSFSQHSSGDILLLSCLAYLSRSIGGKKVLAAGVLWTSIFTVITPLAVTQPWLMVACRVMTGVGEGIFFPTMYQLAGRWIPFPERGLLIGIIFSGLYLGTIIGMVITDPIISHLGWPYVFYITGFAGFVWFCFWMLLAADDPSKSPIIHPVEEEYIVHNLEEPPSPPTFSINASVDNANGRENIKVNMSAMKERASSWEVVKILMGKQAFWAVVLCNLTFNWGFYVMLAWLPTYLNKGLGFTKRQTSVISIMPFSVTAIFAISAGKLNDLVMNCEVRPIVARKIFTVISSLGPAITLIIISFIPMNRYVAAAILSFGFGTSGCVTVALSLNIMEMAPKHAGLVSGIANTFGTIPGIVGIASTGYLLTLFGSWGAVFMVPVIFYVLGVLIFLFFGSSEQIV